MPYYDCSQETLQKMMREELPFSVQLDGVLFYHKESHYTHGNTPLVGWLKGYMFPEILGKLLMLMERCCFSKLVP